MGFDTVTVVNLFIHKNTNILIIYKNSHLYKYINAHLCSFTYHKNSLDPPQNIFDVIIDESINLYYGSNCKHKLIINLYIIYVNTLVIYKYNTLESTKVVYFIFIYKILPLQRKMNFNFTCQVLIYYYYYYYFTKEWHVTNTFANSSL